MCSCKDILSTGLGGDIVQVSCRNVRAGQIGLGRDNGAGNLHYLIERIGVASAGQRKGLSIGSNQRHGRTQAQVSAEPGLHCQGRKPVTPPLHIDKESAPGYQTFYTPFFPTGRQSRQEMNRTVVALQQHVGNAGRPAEVAVTLKRRMGVEQVGIRAATLPIFC